ncbi:hypothetical protein [Chitinimonas naiadis]
MDFARTQHDLRKRLLGIGTATLLHLVMVYALITGTAQRLVALAHAPVQAEIIEEELPPPPPLEVIPPPQFKVPPPPSYIAPPEIKVAPSPVTTTITAVTTSLPETPLPMTPSPPPVVMPVAPPAVVASPVTSQVGVACANYEGVKEGLGDRFSLVAEVEGIQSAEVVLLMTVGPNGEAQQVTIKSASNLAVGRLAAKAAPKLRCKGQGRVVQLVVPFSFKLVND